MVLLKSDCKRLQKGTMAPDFSLVNIDMNLISLSQFNEKALVIIFMCNHCPYVKSKLEEIAAIQRDYPDVAVVCINSNDTANYPDDDFEHMQQLAKEKGYTYYLFDETQDVAVSYGATCTPDLFVFDKWHKLVYHGRINNQMEPSDAVTEHTLRMVLDKMLKNEEIIEWFVPSQGCSIKWKK
jgi:peroxiredoxin